MLTDILVTFAAYLLGSIPFAYIVTKLTTGQDIRTLGDRNVGTRNVMHVVGWLPGMATLLLDGSKGAAACWLARRYASGEVALFLTGVALMVGHGFPLWLGWHGGKGLAAASGFFFLLWPWSVLAAAGVLLIAQRIAQGFDLAFGIAAVTFVALTLVEGNDIRGVFLIVTLLGTAGLKKLVDLSGERDATVAPPQPRNGEQ
jgi:glycerol-3-phosphate acyltransferase PlsY